MIRVLATGTFDILHPGHVLYLEKAKELGDELYVIVSRDATIQHKPKPIIPESQRLRMVQALRVVDHAVLGSEEDIFEPVVAIQPDLVVLGYDQYFDEEKLQAELETRHIECTVVRLSYQDTGLLSSTDMIMREIVRRRVTR